jgi:hypothetical protein
MPEVTSMMDGRPLVPARPRSTEPFTTAWLFGWIAWAMSIAAWLAIMLLKALR